MMSWDMRPTAMIAGDAAGSSTGDQRRSCFCCGEVGHFARDCLKRVNRKSPGASLTCFACGGPGHFARDCPNKFTPNRTKNHPRRPNRTAGITGAGYMSTGGGEGGPNRTAGITRAGYRSAGGGEGGPNRTAEITRASYRSAGGGEGAHNRTAGITRASYRSAGGGEGAPNLTAGITRTGGMKAVGGEGGPNCTAGITLTRTGYKSAGRGAGGPNRIAGITRTGGTSADGGEGGPNRTAGITQASGTSADGGEGGPNRTAGITQASGTSSCRVEGGPNSITGITRAGGTSASGGEDVPNPTVGITRASGTGAGGGEGGPNRTAGITQARGMSAGGLWIRRRELPADQSKDSSSINGGGIGGVPSLNQRSYFPPTLSQENGGSGSSSDEPVNQTYHNATWKYDTSKFFGSNGIAGGDSNREYSNLLNISKGDCGEGSSGSMKDSGEGSTARGLFLDDISSSSSGNDFDDYDYMDFNMWLSWTLLSEGKIMEKRCGFVAKVSEGIDGERSSNGKYTSGKSFNNNGTMSRGPAVIEISSSSSEDEEGIVPKKITGFLFSTGKVKEEIKRVVDDDDDEEEDDDDYDDDDCVILESNPFEPPVADFEQKVSLSEHKSSIVHDEDITIISERGQVACRDYPHSRHHCAKFPFSKTTHESCCPQCYCYICEVVAPCEYWNGSGGHCHASDQDPIWSVMKKIRRDL